MGLFLWVEFLFVLFANKMSFAGMVLVLFLAILDDTSL